MRFVGKKAITLIAAVLLAGLVAQAGEVITFRTWWGYTGARIELLNSMLRRFEEETGIEVRHESPAPFANYLEKLVLDTVGGVQTDVVLGSSFWIADMIDSGLLQPLDGYLARTPGLKEDIFPAIWDGVVYRGQVWALPFAGGPQRVTFQNKDTFSARGLQTGEGVVSSWDAFLSHVLRLTQDVNGDGVPDVFGLDNANQIYAFYWTNGADLFNEDRTDFGFLTPQAIEALEFMIDLQRRGVVGGDFAKGTGAMTLTTGPWGMLTFRETVRFDLAMDLPPQNTDTPRTLSSLDALTLASASEHPEAAWKLIEFLLRPDIHAEWAVTTGFPPVRRSEVTTRVFRTAVARDPLYEPLGQMYEAAVLWPLYPNSNAIWNILRAAVSSVFRGEAPRTALENAHRQAQQYLIKE